MRDERSSGKPACPVTRPVQICGATSTSAARGASYIDRPILHREYDYISSPKNDGYRCVHVVYKYRSRSRHRQCYKDHRIEIQIRSRLQHAWATALETVDAFTGQALKSNVGGPLWKYFFTLMGSAIALRERRPLVPGTPANRDALRDALVEVNERLNAVTTLQNLTVVAEFVGTAPNEAEAVLLSLNTTDRSIQAVGYPQGALARASEDYLRLEKEIAGDPTRQAVLVSVDRVANLRKAFPNYYADTSAFIDAFNHAVATRRLEK